MVRGASRGREARVVSALAHEVGAIHDELEPLRQRRLLESLATDLEANARDWHARGRHDAADQQTDMAARLRAHLATTN